MNYDGGKLGEEHISGGREVQRERGKSMFLLMLSFRGLLYSSEDVA